MEGRGPAQRRLAAPARGLPSRYPHAVAEQGQDRQALVRSAALAAAAAASGRDGSAVRVLVVEDQPALARMLERVLREEGFRVELAFDGPAGLAAAGRQPPDAVVLDVMLPGLDGLAVCRSLRAAGLVMPVIMLTARDAIADRVRGLDAGADDYLVKPFAFEELLARLRAQLRREAAEPERLRVADLVLDPGAHAVQRGGRRIELSALEFRLLEFLMRHPNQVLSRDQIIDHVWGYDADHSSKPVDVYVHYLRKKIDAGWSVRLLRTVRSVGYVLRDG